MSLAAQVRAYNRKFAPKLETKLAEYQDLRPFDELVRRATLGIGKGDTMHGHQCRLGYELLTRQTQVLLRHKGALRSCRSFSQLIAKIEEHSLKGFGRLAQYDTALRIGSGLNLLPNVVYLHSGALRGYRNLGFRGSPRTVDVEDLPAPVQKLAPHHVENFLCIFKNEFNEQSKVSRSIGCSPAGRTRARC